MGSCEQIQTERSEFLDLFFSLTPDLLCIADLSGRFVRLNQSWEKTLGYSIEELKARKFLEFVHPDDRASTEQALGRLAQGQNVVDFVNRYRHQDGSYRYLDWRSCPYQNHLICGVARDITARVASEQRLSRNESRYRFYMDNLQGIAYQLEVGRSQPHIFRGMVEQITGYSAADFIEEKVRWYELVHPEHLAQVMKDGQKLFAQSGYVADREYRIIRKDGSERWVRDIGQNVTVDPAVGPTLFNGLIRDVTEQRDNAERAGREDAFRRAIIDRAAEGLCVYQVVAPPPYVRFTVWNGRMTALTGYTMEEINQLGWYQALYPDPELSARARESMSRMREGEDRRGEEWEITCKDGARRVLSISSTVIRFDDGSEHVLAMMHDLTARKAAEEALRHSEATLRSIFRAAPIGIGLMRDGVLCHVNQRICEITGYSEEELIGENMQYLYPPGHEGDASRYQGEYGLRHQGIGMGEIQFRHKDGHLIDILMTSVPLDPEDLSAGVTFTVLDISERKRAEAVRRKLEAQVQHAQKLESLGVLAGGVAHDFNNLLMVILGNADLARRSLPLVSSGQPYLRDIEIASRRAAGLCRQMLAYSGKGQFVIETLDINKVIEDMGRILKVHIPTKAVLEFRLSPNLPGIDADAVQVRQVLMNLITNASEAIGEQGGAISIATGTLLCDHRSFSDCYLVDGLPEGSYVYVEVKDTGSGMTPEVQSRIFDPFFTTKFTGRGLGMAAVLGIMRGHRGTIKIQSEPGKGTAIKLLFPASENPVSLRPTPVPVAEPWKGSGMVLLVDDEPSVLSVASRMLEMMGFQVVTANDGIEALQVYRERQDEFACVLLDLSMPHLNGEEAYRELRSINRDVRVIITSGYNEQDVKQRFIGEGLSGFLQKPFLYDVLAAKMREVLA
jgi:PAS domain S-box-containing protein